jgi:hypothetical protein
MAGRKKPQEWRGVFLRTLRRTGNVRASAAAAGIDPGTAYDHQHKDPRFAAKWAKALAAARAKGQGPLHRRSGGPPPRSGEELVVRRFADGAVQMVRAAAGRWSSKVEAAFLAELERTGCVRWSAKGAGLSTTALYNRRKRDPQLRAKWAAAEARAEERIPALLSAAAIASLDCEIEGEGLPPVSIDQALAIVRLKGLGGAGRARTGSALRYGPKPMTIEEVRDDIIRRLTALRAHRERSEGAGEGAGDGDGAGPLPQPAAGPPPRPGEEV